MYGLTLPKNIDVVIVSYGGVGTTFLIDFLSKYCRTNDPYDQDDLKHLPVPPISMRRNVRFVYIYGDPVDAVISLFRRNYQVWQSIKLQRYQRCAPGPIPFGQSLDAYASAGVDRLGFEWHFNNWCERYLVRPTLFLKYEALWDNLSELIQFLGLPEEAASLFPKRRPRITQADTMRETTRVALRSMYGDLSRRQNAMDSAFVRGGEQKSITMTYRYLTRYPAIAISDIVSDPTRRNRRGLRRRFPSLFRVLSLLKQHLTFSSWRR